MKTSEAGKARIKRFEGLRLKAYQCSARKWTIGYGHASDEVKPGQSITKHQAEVIFEHDVEVHEAGVVAVLKVLLNQSQFDALVSFTFNVGVAAFQRSTLLKKVNDIDFAGAADEFSKWVYSGGKVDPGLVKRRAAERELFLKPEPT